LSADTASAASGRVSSVLSQRLLRLLTRLLGTANLLLNQLTTLLHNTEQRAERIFLQKQIENEKRDDRNNGGFPVET
jgi:hypothetical protein